MRTIFALLLLGLSVSAGADTFILNDGARIEGEVTGEMDGALLVNTKYGSLTIKKTDIKEQQAPPAAAVPAPARVEISSAVPEAVGLSTAEPSVAVSTRLPEADAAPAPKLTFETILPSTTTRQLVYMEAGVAVATETFDSGGALVKTEGSISDGTYTEYYPDGGLKTVKTMRGGKADGTLKAFYPSGTLQIEAYYLAGAKEGQLKYYTLDGKPLMEATYKNDLLNGWKKEYGADGAVTSESYYQDDRLARPPDPRAAAVMPKTEPKAEPGSMVTVDVISLARGERFTFKLNNKLVGKATLDKEFNIISREGKVPDGTVRVFSKDEKLEKEFVFAKNVIKTLRIYAPGGPLKAEYSYVDDKAVKK